MKIIAETARPARWVIELDYDADPETPAESIQTDIADQFSGAKGNPVVEGSRLIFDHGDDAFAARLRYGANVLSVEPEYA